MPRLSRLRARAVPARLRSDQPAPGRYSDLRCGRDRSHATRANQPGARCRRAPPTTKERYGRAASRGSVEGARLDCLAEVTWEAASSLNGTLEDFTATGRVEPQILLAAQLRDAELGATILGLALFGRVVRDRLVLTEAHGQQALGFDALGDERGFDGQRAFTRELLVRFGGAD